MKVLLVDDESLSLKTNKFLLEQHCTGIQIVGMANNVAEAKRKIVSEKPDLVLLDIKMPGGTGFDLLNEIEKKDFQVIFITAFDHFAIKAFEYSAIDYLLKPYAAEKLVEAINKAKENLKYKMYFEHLKALVENQNTHSVLVVKGHDKTHRLKFNAISALHADNNYTKIEDVDGKLICTSSKTLKYYEDTLPEEQFFRVHLSHVVNRSHIKLIDTKNKEVVLKSGVSLPVSYRRLSALKQWMNS